MKLNKKPAHKSQSVKGPFVAIGTRGVVITDLQHLEEPLRVGRQPILSKARGEKHAARELWNRSCSWITNSRATESDGKAYFTLLPLDQAIKQKKVALHKGLTFKHNGRKFKADVVTDRSWTPKQKQPAYLGVVRASGYGHNRIESKLIREHDGSESRNRHLVCKLVA